MAIASERVRLSDEVLYVEAGGTTETRITVEPFAGASAEEVREYGVQVRGLPRNWYSLSTERFRQPAGRSGEILLAVHPPREDRTAPLGEYQYTVDLVPATGDEKTVLEGRLFALAPGGTSMRSRLLEYLPTVYRDDLFLARFLLIFQSILDPIDAAVDNTHYYLDPAVAPASFLPWLASWVGIELDPALDVGTQRELIRRATEFHRWKGTRRGIREELRARTGTRPLIVENFDGMRIGQDAALGLNTQLGAQREGCITVTLVRHAEALIDQQHAEALVSELKPAQSGHLVRIVGIPSQVRGEPVIEGEGRG